MKKINLTDMLIEQLSLPGGIISGAPSTKKVKKTKKSLSTDRDYVYKPVREQDTYEINQQLQQSEKMPIVQRIALINAIRRQLGEGKVKKVTKQMWKKMKEDQRINALLSVFKDPDDAIEHWEKDWDKLPRTARANDMHLFEGKIDEQILDKLKQIAKDKLPLVAPTSDYESEKEAFKDDYRKLQNIMIPGWDVAGDVIKHKIIPSVKDAWKQKKQNQIDAGEKIFGPNFELTPYEKKINYIEDDPSIEEGTIAGFHTLQENGIAKINGHEMGVEIQSTPEGLEKGLMFKKEIPSGKGMLLKFGKDHPAKIWMKNVKQPLDIIYIKDNQVEDLFKNAMPDMGDGMFDSIGEVMCDMVLELPAGDIEKFDIKPGDMFGFNDLRKQGIAN